MKKSNNESGHAINLANFKVLTDVCTNFGAQYNPGNEDLTVAALTTLWNSGEDGQKALITAVAATKIPIGERELLFKGLSPLLTRVMGAVMSTKASDKVKKDLKSKADAIRGYRKPKKEEPVPPVTEKATEITADEALRKISGSQMSFVQRAKGFSEFIEMLRPVKEYIVNEKELQIGSLDAMYAQMKQVNDGMGAIINTAKMGLIKRDRVLYAAGTGMLSMAAACKSYVKGLFGANSAELKLLTKLQFRDLKKNVREQVSAVA